MSFESSLTCALPDASAVRALCFRLQRHCGTLDAVLVHRWDGWLVRLSVPSCYLGVAATITGEYGGPARLDESARRAFALLAAGAEPIAVMETCGVPVILVRDGDLDEFDSFCEDFSRGIGYCPPCLR